MKRTFHLLASALALSVVLALPAECGSESKPVIGINVDPDEAASLYQIPSRYVDAIRKSGGIPVLLPPVPAEDLVVTLAKVDGVIMIGGDDYPPSLYNEKQHETVELMPKERSDYDVELARAVLKTDRLPFLGICAGCQCLNIASGGSLIQDIPSHKPDSKVAHRGSQGAVRHIVTLVPGSKLAKIYGKTSFEVPTAHHQCVGKVGSQLKVAANTEDGIVESVENPQRPFVVGVQWHPERDFEGNQALFKEFVKQCSEYKLARKDKAVDAL